MSSIGWVENPLKLPYVSNNPSMEIGRHAVAIDERRAFFRTHLWVRPDDPKVPFGPRDVAQVWFRGVHGDVGGGYPETGLSDVTLRWMLAEAGAAGLCVDAARRDAFLPRRVEDAPPAEMHESLRGWWSLAEFVFKRHYDRLRRKESWRMNLCRRRTWPAAPLVHASAYQRGEGYRRRIPGNAVRVGESAATRHEPPSV